MILTLIAAVAENNVIGKSNGELPWHLPEDFKHFKATTLGHPIIMGRKTFLSLGKPLKGRTNIVVTANHQKELIGQDIHIFSSIPQAIQFAASSGAERGFIIGGGELYMQTIELADEMILSHLNFSAEGEVVFPEFDKDEWDIYNQDMREKFTICYYRRKRV